MAHLSCVGETVTGLEALLDRLKDAGITLHLSEVKGPVMDRLQRTHFVEELNGKVFLSQDAAFAYVLSDEDTARLIATGGFSTKQASVAYYDSVAVETIMVVTSSWRLMFQAPLSLPLPPLLLLLLPFLLLLAREGDKRKGLDWRRRRGRGTWGCFWRG